MDKAKATAVAREYVASKFPSCTGFRPVRAGQASEFGFPGKGGNDDYVVSCNFRIRFKSKIHTINLRIAPDGTIREEDIKLPE